jgi:two-component system, LytTR family, sensor kinase
MLRNSPAWLRAAVWYVTPWTVLVVLWALQVGPANAVHGRIDWAHFFALSAINFYSSAVVAVPLTMMAWRYGIVLRHLARWIAAYTVVLAVTSVARFIVFIPLLELVSGVRTTLPDELRLAFVPQFAGLATMLAVVLAIRSVQLSNELTAARLEALQAQLHPHFLFNTLNAVSTLMRRDVDEADEMLARLCDLLRVTLRTPQRLAIPLDEELTILANYVGIMERRFPGKVCLSIDIPPDLRAMPVPPLLLQPLVENVLQHGLNEAGGPTEIHLSAARNNASMTIRVADNGPGLPDESPPRIGIGLENTRHRLETLYGMRARLSIRNADAGGTEVLLDIPGGIG